MPRIRGEFRVRDLTLVVFLEAFFFNVVVWFWNLALLYPPLLWGLF